MANAALKEKIESEIKNGFKRQWAGPVHKCNIPGCNITTRSESGICAACTVDARVEEIHPSPPAPLPEGEGGRMPGEGEVHDVAA